MCCVVLSPVGPLLPRVCSEENPGTDSGVADKAREIPDAGWAIGGVNVHISPNNNSLGRFPAPGTLPYTNQTIKLAQNSRLKSLHCKRKHIDACRSHFPAHSPPDSPARRGPKKRPKETAPHPPPQHHTTFSLTARPARRMARCRAGEARGAVGGGRGVELFPALRRGCLGEMQGRVPRCV